MPKKSVCADCGGFDIEWMHRCHKHGHEYCRGCSCPACEEEAWDDYEEDGLLDLEDQLDNALERADLPCSRTNGERAMSPITQRIIETIYLLRRAPQIDIERLSYELDETEWLIFTRELEANNAATGKDLSYSDALTFMGLTIHKRTAQGKGAAR